MHYQHQHFEITPHSAFALTVVSRNQIPNCKNPFHADIQTDEANLDQISSAFFFDFLGGQDDKRVGLKKGNVIVSLVPSVFPITRRVVRVTSKAPQGQ